MGRDGSSRLPTKNYSGVSHTLCNETTACLPHQSRKSIPHSSVGRDDKSDKQIKKTGCSGSSPSLPKLSVNNVPCPEERRYRPSHIQFKSAERICDDGKVQPSKCIQSAGISSAERLSLQNRPFTGLFSFENKSKSQKVFTPILHGRASGNDMPPFWFEHRSQNFRYPDELGRTDVTKEGCQINRVPGRFSPGAPRLCCPSMSRDHGTRNFGGSRLDDKLRKVYFTSIEKSRLPRDSLGPLAQSEVVTSRQGALPDCQNQPHASWEDNRSKRSPEPSRNAKFCKLCSSERQAKLSCTSKFPKQHFALTKSAHSSARSQTRFEMVAKKLPPLITDTLTTSNTLSNDRRFGSGLGSAIRQFSTVRTVDWRTTGSSLQSERDVSDIKRIKRSLSVPASFHSSDSMRQQNCHCLSQEPGRHKVHAFDELDISSFRDLRPVSNPPEVISSPWEVQPSCGPSLETSSAPGVASTKFLYPNSICKVRNPGDRSICLSEGTRCLKLCDPRSKRQSSCVSRCLFKSMELPTGLDISATVSRTESVGPPQSGQGRLSPSATKVGESILARRPQNTSSSGTIYSTSPQQEISRCFNRSTSPSNPGNNSGSVEMWGWSGDIMDWNSDQISLLQSSWRPSTRKTYSVAWKKWLEWTSQHHINPSCPSGSDFAKFLADLHIINNLSYNTILLYKSAVSTLCNASTSGQLSTHVLVKHVLKSIAIKKPIAQKCPVWDIDTLAFHLKNTIVNGDSIFQVCRHTAMLLLLSSGRRIHDLTLLNIDSAHCVKSEESIIFWPIYGSKTDSSDYRQSGWKLLANAENKNLNPVYWINRAIDILRNRRESVKCNSLFITLRGDVKTASRAIIAGWIKSLLAEANITATPGSTRSAVASKNWLSNHPLEDILARGNWRSSNTFKKFYRREVISAPTSNSVSRLFLPVD